MSLTKRRSISWPGRTGKKKVMLGEYSYRNFPAVRSSLSYFPIIFALWVGKAVCLFDLEKCFFKVKESCIFYMVLTISTDEKHTLTTVLKERL